ncbi:MAG: DUF2000 family protein [bacterium]|nr:DUF2000 family protein [bacterium]
MDAPFDTGEYFTSADGISYPRNSQYPIVILAADAEGLRAFATAVREAGLLHHVFIREMIELSDDAELERAVAPKSDAAIEYLGVGAFGERAVLDSLTKQFRLWK